MCDTTRSERIAEFIENFLHSAEEAKTIFPLYPGEIEKIRRNYPALGIIERKKASSEPLTCCVIYKHP